MIKILTRSLQICKSIFLKDFSEQFKENHLTVSFTVTSNLLSHKKGFYNLKKSFNSL